MTQIPTFANDLLPPKKAAAALRTSRQTIYRWIETGKLLGIKIGGCLFVPLSDIKRFDNDHHGHPTIRRQFNGD
ncbi:hypothetical protein ES703_105150 [subsurface metagenome]